MLIVLKSGSVNLLELSGPVQASTGFALHFLLPVEGRDSGIAVGTVTGLRAGRLRDRVWTLD